MAVKSKIIIVDDDNNIAELISLYLLKECFDTKIVNDCEDFPQHLEKFFSNAEEIIYYGIKCSFC